MVLRKTTLIILFILCLCSTVSAGTWSVNYADWNNRIPITVTNPPSVDNCPQIIIVPFESGMQTDFDDIRFAENNGDIIPFNIGGKTDGSEAYFAINAPPSETTIYLYFNNSAATPLGTVTFGDLVAWYPFTKYDSGASVYDWSGYGNTGSVTGTTKCYGANSNEDRGLIFDGIDDKITIPHTARISPSDEITICAEINASVASANDIIMMKSTDASWTDGYGLYINTNSSYQGFINDNGLLSDEGGLESPLLITTGLWNPVVFQYQASTSSSVMKIYENEALTASKSTFLISAIDQSSSVLTVGYGVGGDYFAGRLSDIRIYDRLINASEVVRYSSLASFSLGATQSKSGAMVADFSANATSGVQPLFVNFTDLSSGSPTAWHWYFGDGSTSSLQNPSHQYDNVGLYNVRLDASSETNVDTETKSGYIEVFALGAPEANFAVNITSGVSPLTVQFYDQSEHNPTVWYWVFGDGDTSAETDPVHTYVGTGFYNISLTVTNFAGEDSLYRSKFIYVGNETLLDDRIYLKANVGESWSEFTWEPSWGMYQIYHNGELVKDNTTQTRYSIYDLNPDEKHILRVGSSINSTYYEEVEVKVPSSSYMIYFFIFILIIASGIIFIVKTYMERILICILCMLIEIYLISVTVGHGMIYYIVYMLIVMHAGILIHSLYKTYGD